MSFTVRQIRYFVAVADSFSVSRAAAELGSEIFSRGVICGRAESVGAPLVKHPLVRVVSLTGDIATDQKILQSAARTMKRTHLELGARCR
ncbi:MAG: aldehyde dehydrogenase family protein [Aeromonas popoffii]|uniref:helix-turn-helix domain-containing protein n=1 Tax=Aeromonas popoffii TaxID=70856 RepID=UPI003F3BAD46